MSILFEPNLIDQTTTYDAARTMILIVEDSEDIRELLSELLGSEGYQLAFATNGEEGVEATKIHAPQLILMDLSLPGMDGWEAVRQIRRMPDFTETPIIALTAHATERDAKRALEVGCSGYISKPFDADELLEAVAQYAQV